MRLLLQHSRRQLQHGLLAFRHSRRRLWTLLLAAPLVLLMLAVLAFQQFALAQRHGLPAANPELAHAASLVLLTLITVIKLSMASRGQTLPFTVSDVDLLFSSPLPPRQVVRWKLLHDLASTAGVALLATFYVRANSVPVGIAPGWQPLALLYLGLLLYLALLSLGSTVAFLLQERLDGERRWVVKALLTALAVGGGLLAAAPLLAEQGLGWLVQPLQAGLSVLLQPLLAASRVATVGSLGWQPALLWDYALLLGLSGLAWWWIERGAEGIWEPAANTAPLRATLRQAARTGDWRALRQSSGWRPASHTPQRLHATGWRTLAARLRLDKARSRTRLARLVGPLGWCGLLLLANRLSASQDPELALLAPGLVVYFAFLCSAVTGTAMQLELRQVDILKPLPLPTWQIVAVLTAVPLLPLIVGLTSLLLLLPLAAPGLNAPLCLGLAVALPAFVLAEGVLQELAGVVFPGLGDVSQRLAMGMATLAGMALFLLPGAVVGGVAKSLGCSFVLSGAAAAVGFLIPALLGLGAIVWLLGRHDPTD
ncbi:MAG: hypothetical protein IT204_10290 [Fimbriimonadaceae bacterium]|nr:hypothetical protein [Fimbriimonadaceae bacterium]